MASDKGPITGLYSGEVQDTSETDEGSEGSWYEKGTTTHQAWCDYFSLIEETEGVMVWPEETGYVTCEFPLTDRFYFMPDGAQVHLVLQAVGYEGPAAEGAS